MKNGFKVLDSDLHTMEPDGLWEQYLDEPFRKFAPRFTRRSGGSVNQPLITIGDLEIAEMSKWARACRTAPSPAIRTTRWRTRAATTRRRICRPWTKSASRVWKTSGSPASDASP